ncbi:hypothetical protein PHISP_06824 [Aspergillus sp. HF37]|nr:hypothetical protein PHISP_06824 [Aspergillus sp. HF37]
MAFDPYRNNSPQDSTECTPGKGSHRPGKAHKGPPQPHKPRRQDEFDGPCQFLQRPSPQTWSTSAARETDLPPLPTNLQAHEQDFVLSEVNNHLSQCAFDFIAKHHFPIPREPKKREVKTPSDREWTEWVHLLKRLATTRRIPARLLFNGQIQQLVTILENSLEMRHAAMHKSRPIKDDRNVLQLVSAGIQVARILKDPRAMEALNALYMWTEACIYERQALARFYY